MDNKNDILALAMYNPQASVVDLLANGITAENTTIHPEQDYLKYEDVKNKELAKKLIEESDIIYIGGGNTINLVKIIKK